MNRKLNRKLFLLGFVMLLSQAANAATGVLLRDEALREFGTADAGVITQLSRGAVVEVLQRNGGWMRVQSGGREGWVRVFSVRGGNETPVVGFWGKIKSAFLQTGADARSVVAVAGLRGIDASKSIAARAEAITRVLDAYRPNPTQVEAFAHAAGLKSQNLAYLDPPSEAEGGLVRWLKRGSGAASEAPVLALPGALLLGKLTPADEQRIGAQIASQIAQKVPLVEDAAVQRYVNQVGGWLLAQAEKTALTWRFGVLDSDEIFSVSAPGGFVFLTRGLYQRLNSEAELAVVLGSEMAQVLRHQPMAFLKEKTQTLAAPAPDEPAAGDTQFLIDLVGDASDYLGRNIDPESLFVADRTGLVLAIRAGYEPFAFAAVLQMLDSIPPDASNLVLFSRTRPAPEARLQHLSESLGSGIGASRFDRFTGQSQESRFRQYVLTAGK
jgi:hypothetical protein